MCNCYRAGKKNVQRIIFSEKKAGMSFLCCGGKGFIWKEISAQISLSNSDLSLCGDGFDNFWCIDRSRVGDKSRCTPIAAKPYQSVQRLLSPTLGYEMFWGPMLVYPEADPETIEVISKRLKTLTSCGGPKVPGFIHDASPFRGEFKPHDELPRVGAEVTSKRPLL